MNLLERNSYFAPVLSLDYFYNPSFLRDIETVWIYRHSNTYVHMVYKPRQTCT